MSLQARITTLEEKRYSLDETIHDEFTHHLSDMELSRLKKKRLLIEDQILRLRKQSNYAS